MLAAAHNPGEWENVRQWEEREVITYAQHGTSYVETLDRAVAR